MRYINVRVTYSLTYYCQHTGAFWIRNWSHVATHLVITFFMLFVLFWGWGVWALRVGVGVKSCTVLHFYGHLFRHFCCRTYHLATMHSVKTDRRRDRQTDRQRYDANSRSYCVQYYRQKTETKRLPIHQTYESGIKKLKIRPWKWGFRLIHCLCWTVNGISAT